MRVEASIATISWIPSENVTGANKLAFGPGPGHYDDPPPDEIGRPDRLETLRDQDAFRFANRLSAWIEVDGDRVLAAGYGEQSGVIMGSTTLAVGKHRATFEAVCLPDLRSEPEHGQHSVTFVQSVGGRTGVPAPRRVNYPPFVQFDAPTVWTTLALTIGSDGTIEHELVGASSFPRHWIYDETGRLAGKVGHADFKDWYRRSFGRHTPWGAVESPVLVTEVESALERQLATQIMRDGERPQIRKVRRGAALTTQGERGEEVFLLLDGVLTVEVDGQPVADVGPGAILGEHALLGDGVRTSTLRARVPSKVAVAQIDQIRRASLVEISGRHRREIT